MPKGPLRAVVRVVTPVVSGFVASAAVKGLVRPELMRRATMPSRSIPPRANAVPNNPVPRMATPLIAINPMHRSFSTEVATLAAPVTAIVITKLPSLTGGLVPGTTYPLSDTEAIKIFPYDADINVLIAGLSHCVGVVARLENAFDTSNRHCVFLHFNGLADCESEITVELEEFAGGRYKFYPELIIQGPVRNPTGSQTGLLLLSILKKQFPVSTENWESAEREGIKCTEPIPQTSFFAGIVARAFPGRVDFLIKRKQFNIQACAARAMSSPQRTSVLREWRTALGSPSSVESSSSATGSTPSPTNTSDSTRSNNSSS